MTHVVDHAPAVHHTVAIGGAVDNPQVYPQEFAYLSGGRPIHLANLMQVEFAPPAHQVGFAPPERQKGKLAFCRDKRDRLPTSDGPDANRSRGQLPGQDAFIICNATVRTKRAAGLAVKPIGVCDLGQQADRHPRGQAVALAHDAVAGTMQIVPAKRPGWPGVLADVVGGCIHRLKRAAKPFSLFRRGLKFDLGNQFHGDPYRTTAPKLQVWKGGISASSPG